MEEYRHYLEFLLEHKCTNSTNCRECLSLERIYRFMQTEIFSTVVYTETPLEFRPRARMELKNLNRAAAGPRRHPVT